MSSPSNDDILALFRCRLEEVSGEYVPCRDEVDAAARLRRLLIAEDFREVVVGSPPLPAWVRKSVEDAAELLARCGDEPLADLADLCARASAGVTGVDGIIADTGTLVMASRGVGDRLVSLLPAAHIAVTFGAPLYATLADYLALADARLTHQFITGPSRTADIEKRLVVGVHGPLRLIVLGPEG